MSMQSVEHVPLTGYERNLEIDIQFSRLVAPLARAALPRMMHDFAPNTEGLDVDDAKSLVAKSYMTWNPYQILPVDLLVRAQDPNRPKITQEQLKERGITHINLARMLRARAMFAQTESLVTYYPEDIEAISNPEGLPSPFKSATSPNELAEILESTPPGVLFPPYWTAQEERHRTASELTLIAHGYDMVQYEDEKQTGIRNNGTPHPINTARGLAYTRPQEANTKDPYGVLANQCAELAAIACELDYEVEAELWNATGLIYRMQQRDEAGHETYIGVNQDAGIREGDAEMASYLLAGAADELIFVDYKGRAYFPMPGVALPNFEEHSRDAMRANLYTRKRSLRNVGRVIRTLLSGVEARGGDLTELGEQALDMLGTHLELINVTVGKSGTEPDLAARDAVEESKEATIIPGSEQERRLNRLTVVRKRVVA